MNDRYHLLCTLGRHVQPNDEVSFVGQIIVPLVAKGFFKGIFQNITIFFIIDQH